MHGTQSLRNINADHKARAAEAYTGHGERTGGLQSHSIGDTYPWAPVGYAVDKPDGVGTFTCYRAENLATGQVAVRLTADKFALVAASRVSRQFALVTPQQAEAECAMLKAGNVFTVAIPDDVSPFVFVYTERIK